MYEFLVGGLFLGKADLQLITRWWFQILVSAQGTFQACSETVQAESLGVVAPWWSSLRAVIDDRVLLFPGHCNCNVVFADVGGTLFALLAACCRFGATSPTAAGYMGLH